MTKIELERVYEILDKCYSDFSEAYSSGSNKKAKGAADKKASSAISLAKFHIERNPEVFSLYSNSKFGHPFADDEFWQPRYFRRDMPEFLLMVKGEIDSFEGPND